MKMNKINILWATIRPHTFVNIYKLWLSSAVNPSNIITHVAVNTNEDADIVKSVLSAKDSVIIVNSDRKGVCYPSYCLSSKLEGSKDDIVVFASDDFLPPSDWDTYLIDKLSNKEGCLMVRDGYQAPDSSNMEMPVITIPILTFGALEKLNKVIYHPAYNHMYSDAELYINVKELGLLIDDRLIDVTEFTHHHYAAGKRNADINDQNYSLKWMEDKSTWNIRKNSPIDERLKV